MQISRRLEAVSEMVTSGFRLADIGTDHGYIPIYLVRSGRVPHAIAMDVNQGPLDRARENIFQYGLNEKIETRRSDGLAALQPGEAESIVIAGMGGALMARILQNGRPVMEASRELILQPQSEIRSFRRFLEKEGYTITRENMILEDGKFYPMMRAVKAEQPPVKMTEAELCFGPLLLENHHPLLDEYLKREEILRLRVLESLDGKHTENAVKRRFEVAEELRLLKQGRELWRSGMGWSGQE